MALADVGTAAGLVTQTIATIQTLLSNWDTASQEWESISSQLRDLRKKSEMWEEQFTKYGMMSDRRLFEMFNNANNLLHPEETKLKEKGQPWAARCCFLLKASMLPVSLGQTLKQVSDEYEKIPRLLEEEQRNSALLEERRTRTPVTPAVPKDARYVRLATTENVILESLQDPNGRAITLLHGASGTGKSTLARALTRHFVDLIQSAPPSDATSFKFDHVAFLEFGRDVESGVEKQCMDLITSMGAQIPSGVEGLVDVSHRLKILLKDWAVLVILDDVWSGKPLEAFMEFRGERVRYLVTTQKMNLWQLDTQKVEMETMSLEDSRKLLAAHIGIDIQEIPQSSLAEADKTIQKVHYNPLALASVASALRGGGRAPSKGEWKEVSNSLLSVLQSQTPGIEIFGHFYSSSLWRSLRLNIESLNSEARRLLVFISMFENTSVPESVLRIVYESYCEGLLETTPMFGIRRNQLEDNGAIIQIQSLSLELRGIKIRSWTLHSLYAMFVHKHLEGELKTAFRSLTKTWKTDDLLQNMEMSIEDDIDPEKIVILLCVLYMEKTFSQEVIEKFHKSWEWIETWKLRRSAAGKILLLLEDTDEENGGKKRISQVRKVYLSYVCSGELHIVSLLFLLTDCGPEAAMLTCDTLDDIITSDRTLKWSEKMWEMVVAVSSLLGQRGDEVCHVLPASVLVGMSYGFGLHNFSGSDLSEQVIGNLFRVVEGDDYEEEVQRTSMIALANLVSPKIPMPVHVPRIVTLLLSHKNPGVKVEAARALGKQSIFEEGRQLVANAMGDEGVTRLTEMLQERASPKLLRWGLQVLTVVDPSKGDTVHVHLKEAHLGRGMAKRILGFLPEALAELDQAHQLDPNETQILEIRGAVKKELKRFHDALEDLNQAHLLDPKDAGILHTRGILKRELKSLDDALEDLNQAHLLDLNDAGILQSRGGVKNMMGQFSEALADFDYAYDLDPNLDSFWIERANAKARLQDFGGALEDLNKAVELQPNNSFYLQERGVLKRMMGDWEGALADLDKGLELEPNDYEMLKHRGYVKFLMGDEEGARPDAERAITIKPATIDMPSYNHFSCLGVMDVTYLNFELR